MVPYPSEDDRVAGIQSGMERGAGESLDRLAELLQTLTA